MYLEDFIYNNVKLSDLGLFVGSAVTDNSESINAGSELKLNTIRNNALYISEIVNADYDGVIEIQFDIIKNPCIINNTDYMTDSEISYIFQWLNSKQYHKFVPIYDETVFADTYYLGTFTTIKPIQIAGKVIGAAVTFTTNAPYGFKEITVHNYSIASNIDTVTINNNSDELGVLYPDVLNVKCLSDGALKLYNLQENPSHIDTERHTYVNNCVTNEVISFDCVHKIISTSNGLHTKMYNDFNYLFPRLYNGNNVFMSSIPCDIYIDYRPIRKVGVIA